jgi:hypothetical protein
VAIASASDLLFRAVGDTDQAQKEFRELQKEIKDTTQVAGTSGTGGFQSFAQSIGLSEGAAGKLAGAMPAVGAAVGIAATGLAAAAAAAVTATRALFDLATQAADYGSEIFDASEKTGLSAEKLSAMKFAADQSGTSLEAITAGSAKFARAVNEAANGSEKAQDKMKRLGVTSDDLDTALGQALKTIAETESGTKQMALAMEAFGKSGTELLPFIKSFDGNLEELTKQAKELGVTIDDEAARAADEFGDQMDTLNAQLSGVARTIGFAVMPEFQKLAEELSDWLKDNQEEVANWGRVIARVLSDSIYALKGLVNFINDNQTVIRVALAIGTFGISEASMNLGRIVGEWSNQRAASQGQSDATGAGGAGGRRAGPGSFGISDEEQERAKAAAEKRAREREAAIKADLNAQVQLEKAFLKDIEEDFTRTLEKLREEFKKTGDTATFATKEESALRSLVQQIDEVSQKLYELERQAVGNPDESDPQGALLKKQMMERTDALNNRIEAMLQADKKLVETHGKTVIAEAEKIEKEMSRIEQSRLEMWRQSERERYETEIRAGRNVLANREDLHQFEYEQLTFDLHAQQDRIEAEKQRQLEAIKGKANEVEQKATIEELYYQKGLEAFDKYQQDLKAVRDRVWGIEAGAEEGGPGITTPTPEILPEQGILDSWMASWMEFFDLITSTAPTINAIVIDLSRMMQTAFMNVARAIGSVVEQWVLYGKTGPAVMRQILAAALASVAAEAAVKAIMATAEGFFFLATHQYESAAWAFTAAAFYGSVAGVAALAGRAIAGNSFNRQAQSGYSTASSSSSGQNSNTSGQGQVYSSREPVIVESGINQATPLQAQLHVKLNSEGVLDVVEDDANRNGRMKVLIERYS